MWGVGAWLSVEDFRGIGLENATEGSARTSGRALLG